MLKALPSPPYPFWFNINDIRWWTCVKSCEYFHKANPSNMPLINKEEFIRFTKNKCHVGPAAITQFYITKYEVTSSYSGLCLLPYSPMPNLSHFSHAHVHATHTHTHTHKCIVPTNRHLSKHSEWLQTKLVGALLPDAVLETSCSHCL
jgi:hypothetical protein